MAIITSGRRHTRRRALALSSVAMLVCCSAALLAANARAEETGSILGKVVDEHGLGIRGVIVCALAVSPTHEHDCTIAGGEGVYSLSGLAPGTYVVEFTGSVCPEGTTSGCVDEYVRQFYDDQVRSATAQTLLLGPGQVRNEIDGTLLQAAIAGRVTGASGEEGLGWTKACAMHGAVVEGCGVSNIFGEYLIPLTKGGEYTVRFVGGTCPSAPACSVQWATEYYSDKFSEALANRVVVTPAAITTGIDAPMRTTGERAVEEYLENEAPAQPIGSRTISGGIEPLPVNQRLEEEFWAREHATTAVPVVVHCVVPHLKGDSLARARRALGDAHCSLGKVHRPKHAGALVVTGQQSGAGLTLPSGAAVGVRLGPRRAPPTTRHRKRR